jgi:hypothetical protein
MLFSAAPQRVLRRTGTMLSSRQVLLTGWNSVTAIPNAPSGPSLLKVLLYVEFYNRSGNIH